MDVQLKRGLLDICVLAAIKTRFLRLSDYKRYETVCGNIRINFVSDFKKIGNRSNAYRQ